MENINSIQWWEDYFGEGKWENNGGDDQTLFFGKIILKHIQPDILDKIEGQSVCDLGCACGELAYLLKQRLPQSKVTGIDFSEKAVEKAKERYEDIEFCQHDVFQLEQNFDAIFVSNVLEHFEDPYQVIKKLLCLANKYLVILVPYQEESLDPSHCYRFDEKDFDDRQYGGFRIIQREVIDASKIENTCWNGKQLLVVMGKSNYVSEIVSEEGTFAKPEVWDKVSEDYKIEIDESEFRLADEIVHIFMSNGVKPAARIIELGCGSGHLSACLALKGYHTTLLDFSEGALSKAEQTFHYYGIEGDFVKGDIFDLSNIDDDYDLVWNSGVMEHFSGDNLLKIFTAIMSSTKNKFIFLVPNPSSISYLLMRYHLQGTRQWSYGMEYLRTNYLDIAKKAGFEGKVIGYAASSISRWHFESTFSDSENASMYSTMVDEGLMPEDEGYLVAYELAKIPGEEVKEASEIESENDSKEKIFELSAVNFSLEKENKKSNSVIADLSKQNQQFQQEITNLREELGYTQDAYGNYTPKHTERIAQLEEENKKLAEGVEFNRGEAERYRDKNAAISNVVVPQIMSETNKLAMYLNAPGFSRMIRLHAVLGVFKHSNFTIKCKMFVKALLRCVGVKKSFYTETVRMDFKIQNCISNIDNTLNLIRCEGIGKQQSITNQVEGDMLQVSPYEEVFVANEPKISVLLPVYNHAEFIRSAIEGVQNQTYKNWELIIINDGSTDNLLEILKDYTCDPRIHMYTQDNQRLPNTLTNLHNLASGQFVTWTSADNIMEPKMLEQLSENLLRHPEAVMVFADVSIIDDKGEFLGFGYREMNRDLQQLHVMRLPHDTEALDAECDNYINACFMYRMDAVNALKGEYSADLEGLEDYDFWLRLRAFGKILHIQNDEPLYRYRVHANTMSEDLLKNKLEQHKKRSELMMEYSRAKDAYIKENWNFLFSVENSEIEKALCDLNYNYEKTSEKKVYVVSDLSKATETKNALVISQDEDVYKISYFTGEQKAETRATFLKGIEIPVLAKKVRQTKIAGLFWEYPVEFANKKVLGCHMDLRNIDIERTIRLLSSNPEVVFSFCATVGGQNKKAQDTILSNCKNAVFVGEKEFGMPTYLYASWNMSFIPPMNHITAYDQMQAIVLAWNIGRWIMVEKCNLCDEVLPFVRTYYCDESILGINEIEQIGSVETLMDQYIACYSRTGVAKRIIAYLNGIGQDIFVKRPDFELIPKERKFPPKELYREHVLPTHLNDGYVAIVVDTLDKGGLEQVVAMLVDEFTTRGMELRVLCTDKGGLIAENLKSRGTIVEEFNGSRKNFEEYIRKNRPILANTHYTKNMLDILKNNNIPIIEVIHNMYVFLEESAWKRERENEKYFSEMIAVSSLVKETYEKKHGNVDQNKVKVIGNCADVGKVYGAKRSFVRKELGIPQQSTVFINVSSIDGRKNQLGIISAFDIYYKTVNQDSYLILVGNSLSEFYDDAVRQYIDEVDARTHILKLDYHREIGGLYNASDVFVMSSYFEGWSIAATEALYCGLPLIHSKCGSAVELTKDGENGVMISNPAGDILACNHSKLMETMGNRMPANTDELVRAMGEITENLAMWKNKRPMIGATSVQEFSKENMIDSYINCFEECLER